MTLVGGDCLKNKTVIICTVILMLMMVAVGALDIGFSEDSTPTGEFFVEGEQPVATGTALPQEKEKPQGERPEDGWLFGFSSAGMGSDYYDELQNILRGYIRQGHDTMIAMNPEADSDLQVQQLREMIELGVDAVFIRPVNREALSPVLKELKEKNIAVINMDQGAVEDGYSISVVDSDCFNAGFILSDYMVNNCEAGIDLYNKAKIVIFSEKGKSLGQQKIYGFREAIGDKFFWVEKEVIISHEKEEIRKELKKAMEEIENFKYIFSVCDEITLSILEVCKEEGYSELRVFSVGGSPKLKKEMVEGNENLEAFAAESPQSLAMNAYSVMMQYLDGETVKRQYLTETFLITKKNIEEYRVDRWQ